MPHDQTSTAILRRSLLLDRWSCYAASLDGPPTTEAFISFGRLPTLERLRPLLAAASPEQVPPLRLALRHLRREKKKGRSKPTGRPRGRQLVHSVAADELPAEWRSQLTSMENERRRLDRGFLIDEDHTPPSLKQIAGVRYTLRALAHACRVQGLRCRLDIAGIVAWLDAAERRGCRPSGLSAQIGQIRTFAVWCDPNSDLSKPLRRLARRKAALALKQRKRKEQWLIDNDISLADIWDKAEALLAASARLPLASRARHKAIIEAVALALAVVVPLRIGDLHRLFVGRDIERTAVGWRLALQTEKTRLDYHRPEIWPELTPFLDALMAADAPGGDFWAGYDLRIGKPLFSFDGESCVHRDWISDVWQGHIGTGAHIVRTLWHEIVGEGDDDRLWVALALCGQKDRRTAREYRVRQTKEAAIRKGRGLLSARRRRGGYADL